MQIKTEADIRYERELEITRQAGKHEVEVGSKLFVLVGAALVAALALLASGCATVTAGATRTRYQDSAFGTADEVNPRSAGAFLGAGRINAFKAANQLKPVPVPTRPAIRPTATPERLPGTPVIPQAPRIVLPSIRPLPQPGPFPAEPTTWYKA